MLKWIGAALAVTLLLAGCGGPEMAGESVVLAGGDVNNNGSASRTLSCSSIAVLEVVMPATGNGTITVTIRDGKHIPIEVAEYRSGAGTVEKNLSGSPGIWTLRVDRSLEMGPDYRVTLTC